MDEERSLHLPGIKPQHFGRQENILVNQTDLSRHDPVMSKNTETEAFSRMNFCITIFEFGINLSRTVPTLAF